MSKFLDMKKLIYLCGAIMLLMACNTTPKTEAQTEEQTIKKEIMASHDTTMAQMNYMAKLRRNLKEAAADTTATDTIMLKNLYRNLEMANDDMMQWMAEFENPDNMTLKTEDKIIYLEGEKVKMLAIEKRTFEAIVEAEKEMTAKD